MSLANDRNTVLVADPMQVCPAMINRCRSEIEGRLKAKLRSLIIPLVRYRYGFIDIGEGFQWGMPLDIARRSIKVGRYVYLGAHASIAGPLVVGDLSMISTGVRIVGNDHGISTVGSAIRLNFSSERRITTIEADCWIGKGAIIREGIRIQRGAVVGAGAIVTRNVAPYQVVAGSPARTIKLRFDAEQAEAHDRLLFGDHAIL